MENKKINFAPFYIGQKVVGSDYAPIGSCIKKGRPYTIRVCFLSINPANGTGPYWYVGVEEFPKWDWGSPKLFSPVQETGLPLMTFKEIVKIEHEQVLINN